MGLTSCRWITIAKTLARWRRVAQPAFMPVAVSLSNATPSSVMGQMCARADGDQPSALVRALPRLDVVVEVEHRAAVRLSFARFASAYSAPLTSAVLGPVIRLRSIRTSPD